MKRLFVTFCAVLLPLTLTLGACGDDDNGNGNDDGNGNDTGMADTSVPEDTGSSDVAECEQDRPVTVSGSVEVHPVTAEIDSGVTLENTKVTLFPAGSLLSPAPTPLEFAGDSGCEPAMQMFTATESSASYSFADLGTSPITLGLATTVDDSEEGDDTFVRTATAVASAGSFQGVEEFDIDSPSFVVSQTTIEDLASAAGASKEEWLSNGIMFGRFVDADGNPRADIQVGRVDSGEIAETLDSAVYPSSDFSDATTGAEGGATSEAGLFIVPNRSLTPFGGTMTSSDASSLDTASQQGATVENTVFTLELGPANGSGG